MCDKVSMVTRIQEVKHSKLWQKSAFGVRISP